MARRNVERFICIFCLVPPPLACLLPNEALRIKCLKDCRHFTWVVWLFKDMPQYTASWNAAQPTVRCVKSILRQRKKKWHNPTLLCKWNKRLVNYGLLLVHQVTKIKHQTNDCKTSLWFAKNLRRWLFFLLLCTIYVHIPATDAVFLDLVQCVACRRCCRSSHQPSVCRHGLVNFWTALSVPSPHKSRLMHIW